MREQFHIDELLSEYRKYRAGGYSSAACTPTRPLYAMLSILKDREIVSSQHEELPSLGLQDTAICKLTGSRSWYSTIASRTEALLKTVSITIPKDTTKSSLSMFSPIAISLIFRDNGIVSNKRAKEKIPSLTTLNMFTLVTFEQAVKPDSLTAPQLEELLPSQNEVLGVDDDLRNHACTSIYRAIKKNKATIRILWDLFATRVDADNPLVTENCIVGDKYEDTIVGTTYRCAEAEKFFVSIHPPNTITDLNQAILVTALYCLPNTTKLYKAIVAKLLSSKAEICAIEKTKEILTDLGV